MGVGSAASCVWDAAIEVGESPCWSPDEQAVYLVDGKAHQVHRWTEDAVTTWEAPGEPGFLVPRISGGYLCGIGAALYGFCPETGVFERLADLPAAPGIRINDGFAAADGRVWFGTVYDPGEKWVVEADGSISGNGVDRRTIRYGALHSFEADGAIRMRDADYAVTNGPVISLDGRTLWHTDSLDRTVYAFDLGGDGELHGKRPFLQFDDGVFPDGMAVDADGNLWIALYNGGRVEKFAPDGARLDTILLPCAGATKPCFGGEDLRTLYITTARLGLRPEALEQQPLAGGLFAVRVDTPGLPGNCAW